MTEPHTEKLLFHEPMNCTHVYPDGKQERVRYGYLESIQIVAENGWPAGQNPLMLMGNYYVEEVTKLNGTKVVFDKPWILHHKDEYGDGSGRKPQKHH